MDQANDSICWILVYIIFQCCCWWFLQKTSLQSVSTFLRRTWDKIWPWVSGNRLAKMVVWVPTTLFFGLYALSSYLCGIRLVLFCKGILIALFTVLEDKVTPWKNLYKQDALERRRMQLEKDILSDESSAVRIARSAPQISEMVTLNEIAIEMQSENSSETV